MIEVAILGLLGVMAGIAIPISLRWENRLTRVEAKMDAMLKHDGIEPGDCVLGSRKGDKI